ncbi:biotin transporter BioY [Candidatus Uabimicrobium amorphum]|uniref:Biotin transporter n=1 Tax=Uabimicrobium amorphum TaxID=2596890 RepID=A0A5S9IHB4_UABAM|nr:biotin transporter BioY [Candidatus Uabimicrobium amorphum]BBM81809.1 BioY family transporter [Candidatus Uabimicrobium amorphum]
MVFYSLIFTILIIIGSQISIDVPMSPVPIVLANFFTLLSGLLLGKKWGTISVAAYLLLGAIGFPVFAGSTGGLEILFGKTGGYLFAYLLSTFLVGMISTYGKHSWKKDIFALIVGVSTLFLVGLPWLKISLGLSWTDTISIGCTPYLLGAAIKATLAFAIAQIPLLRRCSLDAVHRNYQMINNSYG